MKKLLILLGVIIVIAAAAFVIVTQTNGEERENRSTYTYQSTEDESHPVAEPSTSAASDNSEEADSETNGSKESNPETTTPAEDSKYGTLLKGGTFTYTGIMSCMGNTSSTGQPFLETFNIYTDYLVDGFGRAYPLYELLDFEGVNCRSYKCNDNLYYLYGADQTLRKVESSEMMGIRVSTVAYYVPGDMRAVYSSSSSTSTNTGGSSTYGGSTTGSSSQQSQASCKVCYGTGICQNCNGRGAIINHYTGEYSICTYCNTSNGTSPLTGKCYACKGTGKR